MRSLFKRRKLSGSTGSALGFWDEETDEPCVCREGSCSAIEAYTRPDQIDPHDFDECLRCYAEIKYDNDACPNNPEITFFYLREQLRKRNREIAKERETLKLTKRQTVLGLIFGITTTVAAVVSAVFDVMGAVR